MKFLVLLALVGCATAATKQDKTKGRFVYDLLKPALNAAEVAVIMASRTVDYPTYNSIPTTAFSCGSKAQPGFYANVETQCQVFHRCDQNGNQTDYLCVNTTVFNQITLVCDYFYNVDCAGSQDMEDFANSRLYTNQPLFDTPPEGYLTPAQKIIVSSGAVVSQVAPKASGRTLELTVESESVSTQGQSQ